MEKAVYIGTNKKQFKKVLEAHTDKAVENDKTRRIIEKYSHKFNIKGEVATFLGKRIHVDYLPTLDVMCEAKIGLRCPEEVVGSALFKIEKDYCIFLTDSRDPKLERIYDLNRTEADPLAERLWKLNTDEFDNQWTHVTAAILAGSFATVFGKTYGDWRKSLNMRAGLF